MPYIDIVNEILENYVTDQTLDTMPAYDTGTAAAEDLLAQPANITPAAYTTLKAAKYPMTLPFDLWLETVRGFCQHFDTPLWQILDALRPTDELYPPAGVAYGRAAVFRERLGVPPAEQAILTDPQPLPSWLALYGYDGATVTEAEALDELRNAKRLAQRLSVSYRDLVSLVRTRFLNPFLASRITLRKLDIDVEDAFRYRGKPGYPPFTADEAQAFEAKIGPEGVAWLQAVNLADFDAAVVLAQPTADCSFDDTAVAFGGGSAVPRQWFIFLSSFVRVWRRLGWSIEETDQALAVFLPTNSEPWTESGIGPAMASVLLGLDHYLALAGMLRMGRKTRQQLLALWAPLDDRRYAELFLTGDPQTRDAAFDHPLGLYLSALTPLGDHLSPVLAALRLTADEVDQILTDAQIPQPAALSMQTVSALHRYGLLPKLLRISVADLIAIKELSGLNPFTPPQDGPVTQIAQDHALRQTIGFVEVVNAAKDSGLDVADLRYLSRHRFEPVGPHRAALAPPLALIRQLAAGVRRIRAEHAVPTDPLTVTDEVLRQKLALVFPADVVDTLLRMWTDTAEYRAAAGVPPAGQLDPADFAAVPELQVSYDAVAQQQTVTYRGVLLDTERAALLARVTGSQPAYLSQLLDDVQQQPQDFFDRYVPRKPVPGVGVTGFLGAADYEVIFAAPPLGQDAERARRDIMATTFLPFLQDQLIRRLVVTTAGTELAADLALTETLISNPALLDVPDDPGKPLLAAYAAIGESGTTQIQADADTVRITGYLEVPTSGPYRFFVPCQAVGIGVELRFDHLADPLLRTVTTQRRARAVRAHRTAGRRTVRLPA
jgi:hypothetical protein